MSLNERLFNFSDAILLEHATRVEATLPNDIADFVAFDSTFDQRYPVQLTQVLSDIASIKPDQVVVDEQAALTETLNNTMAACNNAFRTIVYFVRKAFPDSKAKQNQFGLNDIKKVRDNQPSMILFMETFATTVAQHKDELIAQGCNAELVDQMPALSKALKDSNLDQEKFKKGRGIITQERVIKLNELYKLLIPISEIAQIIYADNPAMLNVYLMPKPKSSSNSADDLIV